MKLIPKYLLCNPKQGRNPDYISKNYLALYLKKCCGLKRCRTWLSKRGCNMAAADPRARYPSDPYDPTGSKLYTTPLPVIKNGHIKHHYKPFNSNL